jgi:hydroxyacylglutathione hydrolase
VTAMGEKATLVLLGDDYDGGHKAWVRWPDGRDDIVPGSQVSLA